MPFLPALAAVIGIGLHCDIREDILFGDHYQCSNDMAWFVVPSWEREFGSLPVDVQKGLARYEPTLVQHLSDHSKLCPAMTRTKWKLRRPSDRLSFIQFQAKLEMEIAQIFCPDDYWQCHNWEDGERCLKSECSRSYPLYATITSGINKLHRGCFHGALMPEWQAATQLVKHTTQHDPNVDDHEINDRLHLIIRMLAQAIMRPTQNNDEVI